MLITNILDRSVMDASGLVATLGMRMRTLPCRPHIRLLVSDDQTANARAQEHIQW
jgi:hypothetical protein